MMAPCNRHHPPAAAIITLLALLAPMACHAAGTYIYFPFLCSGGWVHPITIPVPLVGPVTICPSGSTQSPLLPSPGPSEPAPPSGAGLYPDYYNSSYSNRACPNAEAIVRQVVDAAMSPYQQGPGIGAGLIRLHFHDCFVVGCDASVLLTTTKTGNTDTEREGRPNKDSLRGFDVIDSAKAALEAKCPGVVSCADIVAFAARDAARGLSGGNIEYAVPGGRLDGQESFADNTTTLPGPFSDLATLRSMFYDQGLSWKDLVLLSAAHSIGNARCMFISKNSGMNQTLVGELNQQCQSSSSNRVNQDYKTPYVLDSQYYDNVEYGDALFDSDYALTSSPDTSALVDTYKTDSQYKWEKDFGQAMVKMGKIKIRTKAQGGQIRKQCWTYNAPPNY